MVQLCVEFVDLPLKVYVVFEVLNGDFGLSAVFVTEGNIFFTLLVGLDFWWALQEVSLEFLHVLEGFLITQSFAVGLDEKSGQVLLETQQWWACLVRVDKLVTYCTFALGIC